MTTTTTATTTAGATATLVIAALAALLLALPLPCPAAVRLKDLADVQGVRENELLGYGLVVGLAGTGDTERVLFTQQSLAGMLGRLGVRVNPTDVRARNVAAVMVTARLPAFSRPGNHLDVAVASLGNARSLGGGILLLTPLNAADGQVYAVAQGAVQVGGYDVLAGGSSLSKNTPTTGRVPAGATVERAVTPSLAGPTLVLGLHRPDFTTANRIAAAINAKLGAAGSAPTQAATPPAGSTPPPAVRAGPAARALDSAAVEVTVPERFHADPVALMAELEVLEVEADGRARVVVSERTGTVVAGERVRIRPVAVSHGGLQVSISLQPVISQPGASFSQAPNPNARTVVTQTGAPSANEESRGVIALPATTTVQDLAKALSTLGASARDLVSILQAMKAAGALDAELEVI
ncbi:MAG TPA: flagellar basal body P-ring protein FlgI [Anaeromyxobacteraceae bacterium]